MSILGVDPLNLTYRRRIKIVLDRAAAAVTAAQSQAGAPGRSAFQVAQDNGYTGTPAQWLASLVGAKGDSGTSIKGDPGVGVKGDPGASVKGDPGMAGASAYQLAVAAGYAGTQAQWLASLTGTAGPAGLTYLTAAVAPVAALALGGTVDVTLTLPDVMPNATYQVRVLRLGALVGTATTITVKTRTATTVTLTCSAAVAVVAAQVAVIAWA